MQDCFLCPRLVNFREENRQKHPGFYNGPVPSFGSLEARLLVVGLAPGLKGANATGRPFTGDYAGIVLYEALLKHGFAQGDYGQRADDGLELIDCRISNAVRCVPPENKPEPAEIKTCNAFLKNEIAGMPNLKVILSLGQISHNAVLRAFGCKLSQAKFAHGALHVILSERSESKDLKDSLTTPLRGFAQNDKILLLDSYHCSRYNINTGALTVEMFDKVMQKAAMSLA